MDLLNEKIYLAELFNIYQTLLTEKQQSYFALTINEDLSLQEVAERYQVSRNAVHDANQKTAKLLVEFEEKLEIFKKQMELKKILDQYSTTKSEETKKLIKEIQGVI